MSAPAVLQTKEGQWVVLGLVAVVVVYYIGKKVVGAAGHAAGAVVNTAAGAISGNNALTQGTAYQGAGILGTLGAAFNSASGGGLASIGEWLGGKVADATLPDPTAQSTQATNRDQVVTQNFLPDVSGVLPGAGDDDQTWD
jgi:hypothetical protein